MGELNKRLPQLPWIVAAVGAVIAVYFFFSAIKINNEILDCQNEIDAYDLKLGQFEDLEDVYGYASEKYHAKQPVLILKTEGPDGTFTVYWDREGEDPTASLNHPPAINAEWMGRFDSEKHLADVKVTPGNTAGCYPITFSDDVSTDTFQVLIVVK